MLSRVQGLISKAPARKRRFAGTLDCDAIASATAASDAPTSAAYDAHFATKKKGRKKKKKKTEAVASSTAPADAPPAKKKAKAKAKAKSKAGADKPIFLTFRLKKKTSPTPALLEASQLSASQIAGMSASLFAGAK